MTLKNKIFAVIRILLGCLFITSGFEKLSSSYQNFLYVVQNYDFLPATLASLAAHTMPWVEFLVGVFMVTGLWTKQALVAACLLFLSFMGVVGQALVRGLEISECGCFGGLISFPLTAVFILDSIGLLVTIVLISQIASTQTLSADRLLDKSQVAS